MLFQAHRAFLQSGAMRQIKVLRLAKQNFSPCSATMNFRYLSTSPRRFDAVSTASATSSVPPLQNVLDVSLSDGADLTISQVAEGLSSDLITAADGVVTLQDMGLGSYYTPVGLLQNALDFLNTSGLPWWLAIGASTIIIKTLMFPLVVKSQKSSAIMNNRFPLIQELQQKVFEARVSGNEMEYRRLSIELMLANKGTISGIFPPMLAQSAVFISFFFAIRGMANLPLESMKTGGLSWFTDLTIADPLYILPVITCATLFVTLELGVDTGIRAGNMANMKYVLRAMPIVMFPFIIHFPSAILCYWCSSNAFGLVQSIVLRTPRVRDYFKIPKLLKHENLKKKNIVNTVKDSWSQSKMEQEIKARHRGDEIRFKQAALGQVVKTYRYNPTIKQNKQAVKEN